jgi:hypothetical protein
MMMRKDCAVKKKTVQRSSGTHTGCNRTAGATGRCHEEPRKNREDLISPPERGCRIEGKLDKHKSKNASDAIK